MLDLGTLGGAVAVSDTGAVAGSVAVAGSTTERKARVWTNSGSVELPGNDTRANGISADGTVVVGYRLQDVVCRRPPCGKYEVPMVWTLASGIWTGQELLALDGNSKSSARATDINVAGQVVGYSGIRTSSPRNGVVVTVMWTLP